MQAEELKAAFDQQAPGYDQQWARLAPIRESLHFLLEAVFAGMAEDDRQALVRRMKALVEGEGAAFDIESHRNAPAGLRIWCGCTVDVADIEALTPWLDWAFETALAE